MEPLQTIRLLMRPFSMEDLQEAHRVLDGHPDVIARPLTWQTASKQHSSYIFYLKNAAS